MKFIFSATIGIIHFVLVRGITGQDVKEAEEQYSLIRNLQDTQITFQSPKWSQKFNERKNNPNPVERVRRPLSRIKCRKRRCSLKRLLYYKRVQNSLSRATYDSESVLKKGASHWTGFFSEEGGKDRNREFCPTDSVVTKIECHNSFCDNIRLECTKVSAIFRRHHHWYSSQSNVSNREAKCPGNDEVIVGVQCHDSYCSSLRVYCSKITMRHELFLGLTCILCVPLVDMLKMIPQLGFKAFCPGECVISAEMMGGGPEDPVADTVSIACPSLCIIIARLVASGIVAKDIMGQEVCAEVGLCRGR